MIMPSVRLNGLSPLFNAHSCLFVCLFVVCLLVHTFVWIHVNVHVRMRNNQRDIGKLFHQHGKKLNDLPNLGHFATFQFWPYPTFQSTAPPCIKAIIITRVSIYKKFNNLSDDTKHVSIIIEIREQLMNKLRFPNFFEDFSSRRFKKNRKLLCFKKWLYNQYYRAKSYMILVSFFSEYNVLSDEICYIFEYQSNENRAFRFFGTLGIVCAQTSSPVIHTFPSITPPTEHLPYRYSHRYLWGMISDYQTIFRYLQEYAEIQTPDRVDGWQNG